MSDWQDGQLFFDTKWHHNSNSYLPTQGTYFCPIILLDSFVSLSWVYDQKLEHLQVFLLGVPRMERWHFHFIFYKVHLKVHHLQPEVGSPVLYHSAMKSLGAFIYDSLL